jgi:group I intron endonuclease
MRSYFSLRNLKAEIKRSKSIIYRSLIKYGYSSFTLEILEYCEPSVVISREQKFIDLLKPDYNILKIAGSSLGFKHSKETKLKISSILRDRIWTPEYKAKIWNLERRIKQLELIQVINARKTPNTVEVLDTLTNKTTVYNSIDEAGQALGCTETAIRKAFKDVKIEGASQVSRLLKRRYIVAVDKSVENNSYTNEWKTNAHRIEVLDTLTGNTTVSLSIREAAAGIGVVESTVRNALKIQKEKGIFKLIKKRYQVKRISVSGSS